MSTLQGNSATLIEMFGLGNGLLSTTRQRRNPSGKMLQTESLFQKQDHSNKQQIHSKMANQRGCKNETQVGIKCRH